MTLSVPRLLIALDPLIAEAKRRTRLRRSLFALVLLLLVGVPVGLALLRPSPRPGALHPLGATAHVGKLSVSIPRGFHVYTLSGGAYRTGTRAPVVGHVLTDYRAVLDPWIPSRGSSGAPSNGVALELEENWAAIDRVAPVQLHLPLSVTQPWFQEHSSSGAAHGYRWGEIRFDNVDYRIMYWIGPAAPASDRVGLLRALRSIRPTR
ncbi:MAG TPA: hypothetical protein VFL58_10320 [Gaiellaceae bacterium]|nr:hypothetical protein [Gaiellaceae bacterium]